jgi:hypothetical protein
MTIFHDRESLPSANSNASRISPSGRGPSQPPIGLVAAGHGMSIGAAAERLGVEHYLGSGAAHDDGAHREGPRRSRDQRQCHVEKYLRHQLTVLGARRAQICGYAPTGGAEIASLSVGVMRPRWRLCVGLGNAWQRHAAEGAGPPQRYCLSSGMLLRAGRIGR